MTYYTAKQIFENCIHKHIGNFTTTERKRIIEDIEKFLKDKINTLNRASMIYATDNIKTNKNVVFFRDIKEVFK